MTGHGRRRLFDVLANSDSVEVDRTQEGQRSCRRRLATPALAVCGEAAVNTEPAVVDAVVAVSHGAHQQMGLQHVHKHAGNGGHDHSQGSFFEQGEFSC
jgi:hypothetical protein